jgi:hypothetical protein
VIEKKNVWQQSERLETLPRLKGNKIRIKQEKSTQDGKDKNKKQTLCYLVLYL